MIFMTKVVRHSIRYKITAMALGVSVLAVVLCGAVAVFGMRNMIREAATASQSLGETAAYDSRTALVGQAQDGLKEQVKQKAELTEERLLNIAGQVETTAGYMSGVYQNPERYLPRPVEKPAMEYAGKWALQYSLVEDVDYEAVQEEIDLAGNLYHIVAPLCEGNDTVSSIYFSSANGFMISYDKNSDNMFEGKTAGQPAELFVDHYDPRDRDWYQEAVETGKSVFTETYLDTFGRLLISCAAPVYGRGTKPVGVLAIVNNRLCENNEADMFVTVFIGVFEISSGIFTFSNAGHNYPLLYRKGGAFDWLKSSPDFVIAGMEGMKFRDNRVAIHPGDRLFLYTDGVTEALNRKEELYGDDRLIETLNRPETREMSIDELVTYMKADLASYADGAEQADDITMLVLEIREGEK